MFKSSQRCSRWAGLLGLAILAAAPAPGRAQENPLFFGVWQPSSTSAGGFPLTFEPGRTIFWDQDELVWEEHYEIIKDLGDRIVVKMWTVKADFNYPLNKPGLVVFSVERNEYNDGTTGFTLAYDFCASDQAEAYFFESDDRQEIWRRIRAWSARHGEGFAYDHCNMTEDGLPYEWSGMGFSRAVRAGE